MWRFGRCSVAVRPNLCQARMRDDLIAQYSSQTHESSFYKIENMLRCLQATFNLYGRQSIHNFCSLPHVIAIYCEVDVCG